jgi:hypothetical protein
LESFLQTDRQLRGEKVDVVPEKTLTAKDAKTSREGREPRAAKDAKTGREGREESPWASSSRALRLFFAYFAVKGFIS